MTYIPGGKKMGGEGGEFRESQPSRAGDIDSLKLEKAYADLAELQKQTREEHIEMMLNLAIAAEYKDADTGNHILRISDYSIAIGSAMGLSQEEVDHLRYACTMHDIGKLGIPDKILQKPGKLTFEEWQLMRQHTTIGARMFRSSKSPLLRAASEIALTHHEKYDGSGYPQGLKGKDIPVFGRIVALADVFDAILSKRCYKEASSFDEALSYIKSISGSHLDPDIVQTFLTIEGQVRKIYDANQSILEYIRESNDEITGSQQDIELKL